MFRTLRILFLWMISISFAHGQAADMASMEISVEEDTRAIIDAHISKYIAEGKLPGGVFMAAKDGHVIFQKAIGNNKEGDPYEIDDIFRIASMTKAITSVAIMQLYEQGKIELDEEVSKYIPAFTNVAVLDEFNSVDSSFTTVPLNTPLTIRNLLSHTSGIYYGDFSQRDLQMISAKLGLLGIGLAGEGTTEDMVNHIARQPLAHQPGAKWTYGLNMEVLGRIVHIVSGQNLAEYFRKNILDPLDMEDTWFYLPGAKHDRLTEVYAPVGPAQMMIVPIPMMKYPTWPNRDYYAGGGGLSGTASDYLDFTQALVNGGQLNGNRILKEETVDLMASDQLDLIGVKEKGWVASNNHGFSLGFRVLNENSLDDVPFSPGTYSWSGYFNTRFWIDPELDLVFVGMTQIVPFQHNEFWDELYQLVYQLVEEE
ncbi:MAG: beta-lactamase family protein [Bacteroidia bacterium]|nr:beta-lactamase family protein [Bacteroidia bacterium]